MRSKEGTYDRWQKPVSAPPRRRSLVRDITLIIAAAVFFISVVSMAAIFLFLARANDKQFDQKSSDLISFLKESLEIPLWSFDTPMVTKLGEMMMTHDIVASLTIKDDDGHINFEARKEGDDISVVKTEKIEYQGNSIGSVELGLSRRSYNEHGKQTMLIALAAIIVLMVNVFWIVIFVARRFLKKTLADFTHPIDALAQGNYQFGQSYAPRIELEGVMARFNQMAAKIESREKSLVEANQALRAEIDEREKVEQLLRKSEERYRSLNENLPVGVFRSRPDGEIVSSNSTMDHLLGGSGGAAEGRKNANTLFILPEDRRRFFEEVGDSGQVKGFECQVKGASGDAIWVSISARDVLDQHGHSQYIDGIFEDITKRRQTEEELDRYRDNLEKMVNERTLQLKAAQNEIVKKEKMAILGQLTSTVSHELRNPLGVIRSSNFFLQRRAKDLDAIAGKHFTRIDEQVSLCDRLITDLLEYTHGSDPKMIQLNLFSWLPQVIHQIEKQEMVAVALHVSPDLQAVPHDVGKMQSAMLKLLHNAAQAVKSKAEEMIAGGEAYTPHIRVEIVPEAGGVAIILEDNGIGMGAETKRHALEPLFTTRARGAGLGLAIANRIVGHHGGRLTLESQPGIGTRITLFLPSIGPQA